MMRAQFQALVYRNQARIKLHCHGISGEALKGISLASAEIGEMVPLFSVNFP